MVYSYASFPWCVVVVVAVAVVVVVVVVVDDDVVSNLRKTTDTKRKTIYLRITRSLFAL